MHTFGKPKQSLAVLIFAALFSAGSPVFAEMDETSQHEAHHAKNSLDWPGIYLGFLPCADCNGLKTSLALNQNNSYVLITQYVGKSPREFVEKGKFTWSDKDNTIVLTPRNSGVSHQYFVGENMLIKLDDNGRRFSGKLAERYILRRTDVTSEPQSQHSGH